MELEVCLTTLNIDESITNVQIKVYTVSTPLGITFPETGTYSIATDFNEQRCKILTIPNDATDVELIIVGGPCDGPKPIISIGCEGDLYQIAASLTFNNDTNSYTIPYGDTPTGFSQSVTIGTKTLQIDKAIADSGIIFVYLNCVGEITYKTLAPVDDQEVSTTICVNSINPQIEVVAYTGEEGSNLGETYNFTKLSQSIGCNSLEIAPGL